MYLTPHRRLPRRIEARVRKALKALAGTAAALGVLLALALWYLGTQVTVRGPVLHAITGIGGVQPTSAHLAGLRLAPGFTLGVYAEGLGPARVRARPRRARRWPMRPSAPAGSQSARCGRA